MLLQALQLSWVSSLVGKAAPSQEEMQEKAQLLLSGNEALQEAATQAVKALKDACVDNMGRLAGAGAVPPVLCLLRSSLHTEQARGAALVCCLAFHAPNRIILTKAGRMGPLVKLLESDDRESQAAGASAVLNMVASRCDHVDFAPNTNASPALMQLLQSSGHAVQEPICSLLGRISAHMICADALMDAGATYALVPLLNSDFAGLATSGGFGNRGVGRRMQFH